MQDIQSVPCSLNPRNPRHCSALHTFRPDSQYSKYTTSTAPPHPVPAHFSSPRIPLYTLRFGGPSLAPFGLFCSSQSATTARGAPSMAQSHRDMGGMYNLPQPALAFACCLFSSTQPKTIVISTEAMDSFTVRCAAERPPHFAFVVACSCLLPLPVLAFVVALASEVGPGFSPGIRNPPRSGLRSAEGRADIVYSNLSLASGPSWYSCFMVPSRSSLQYRSTG
jgi:hypothetical protein